MTKEYYNTLLQLYKIQENTNALSTTGNKRPPIEEQKIPDARGTFLVQNSNWKTTLDVPSPT
eukprot:5419062-Amphidinium_carterae.1